MATFPRRKADVAALAGTIINGLTEHGHDFPDCPVTVETLQAALPRYRSEMESAETAEGAGANVNAQPEFLFPPPSAICISL